MTIAGQMKHQRKNKTLFCTALLFAAVAVAGGPVAHAQATGPSVYVCSSETVDSNYWADTVEETICLSGNASGLDSYEVVDLERYQQNVLVDLIGADAQIWGPSGLASDTGEQQGTYVTVSGWAPSPQIGAWYTLYGLYDECDDYSYSGNGYCDWTGLMGGLSLSAMVTGAPTPTLSVSTSGTPSTYIQSVTFTATISSGPTGSLTFYDGSVPIGTGTITGTTATITTNALSVGNHSITAAWAGNSGYPAVTSSAINQAVNQPAGLIYSYSVVTPGGASGYAPNGNVLNYTDTVNGTWSIPSTGGYDNLNRLTNGSATSGPYQGLQANWSYDSFGNRTSQSFSGSNAWVPINTSAQFSDGTNHVTSSSLMSGNPLGYDAAGDVTVDNLHTYLYDAEGRVCAVAPSPLTNGRVATQYLYDAEGTRVAKGTANTMLVNGAYVLSCDTTANGFSATEEFILGSGGEQLAEMDGSGTLKHANVFAGGAIATYDIATNNTIFALTDWLGTKRMEVGTNLSCATGYTSLPFGDALTPQTVNGYSQCADDATEHHFTGKERDAESGNDYFGARYYASSMGSFMSPDPMLIMKQKMTDPQQWNMYSYVRNNPLRMVDNNGKWPTEIHNQIIAQAFPGLSAHQVALLQSASASMDHCMTCQLERNSYTHYMRAPGQSASEAKQQAQNFIHTQEHLAQDIQETNGRNTNGSSTPANVSDIKDQSLSMFGNAGHTVMDGTSPAHVDDQGNPRPWDIYTSIAIMGVGTLPSIDLGAVDAHESEESTITDAQRAAAVSALQQAFRDTYGNAAAQQATTSPDHSCSVTGGAGCQ